MSSEHQAKVDRLKHHMQTGDWVAALALAEELGFDGVRRIMERRIEQGLELVRTDC